MSADLIRCEMKPDGDEILLDGDDGCGQLAVQASSVQKSAGGLLVEPGTLFRAIHPAKDQLVGRDEEKARLTTESGVYSTTCLPFGNTYYLYECTPKGLKYIGPCGMQNCAYPCSSLPQ